MFQQQKVLIWSNSLNNTTLSQYSESILQNADQLRNYDIHVLLNRCIPIQANEQFFKHVKCIFIGRTCQKLYDQHGMHGGSFLLCHTCFFNTAYMCNGISNNFDLYTIDLEKYLKTFELDNSVTNNTTITFDYIANGFCTTKYGLTTGFIAYLFMSQFTNDITLCNFGVKDNKFKFSSSMHTIVDEDKWLNEHNVKRISI